ncbi:MAG TPA: hypothetical protein VL094_11670 [Sphingomonadaceae bacterium]|nr:hypothetical protein [Sphingomonadaceae bacterium]
MALVGAGAFLLGVAPVAISHMLSATAEKPESSAADPWADEPNMEQLDYQQDEKPTEEPVNVPALLHTAQRIGFQPPYNQDDFNDCASLAALNPAVSNQTTCNDQPMAGCPQALDHICTVQANFSDGMLRDLSFTYEIDNVDAEKVKNVLNDNFGKARTEYKNLGELGIESWSSRWKDDQATILLFHIKGINIEGVPYDNLSVTFTDTSIPDPMKSN